MTDRPDLTLDETESTGNRYLDPPEELEDDSDLEFFSSGCTVLDCALGRPRGMGWGHPRVHNIIGDKSTGKTELAIEGCANFRIQMIDSGQYPNGEIHYRETEEAFDIPYAKKIGFPAETVDFGQGPGNDKVLMETIEEFGEDLAKTLNKMKDGQGGLYVLDSFDALSYEAELHPKTNADGTEKGSFGAEKAKFMSRLFRENIRLLKRKRVSLMIISQIRDNVGVMFGRTWTRTGGKALDFYASQILFISQPGKIERTIDGVTRKVGVRTKALVDKNKVGNPYRECEFPISFGYGIDDLAAGVEWLKSVKRLDAIFDVAQLEVEPAPKKGAAPKKDHVESLVKSYLKSIEKMSGAEYRQELKNVSLAVKSVWDEIEAKFANTRKKYE